MLGLAFGIHAIDLIRQDKYDRMVAWSDRRVVDVSLTQATQGHHQSVDLDGTLVKTARGLGICLGD